MPKPKTYFQYYVLYTNRHQLYRLSEDEAVSDVINQFLENPDTEFIIFDPKARKIMAAPAVLSKFYFHNFDGCLDEVVHTTDHSAYEYIRHYPGFHNYSLFNNQVLREDDIEQFVWDIGNYNQELIRVLYDKIKI